MKAENIVTWSRALVEGGDVQSAEVRTPALGHFLDRRFNTYEYEYSTCIARTRTLHTSQGLGLADKVPYLQYKENCGNMS